MLQEFLVIFSQLLKCSERVVVFIFAFDPFAEAARVTTLVTLQAESNIDYLQVGTQHLVIPKPQLQLVHQVFDALVGFVCVGDYCKQRHLLHTRLRKQRSV